MSESKNNSFIRLGIIAGIVLLALLAGKLFDEFELVVDILSAIGLVLIGITILVTIHELGHFLTAKAFGMRVETFSIGFPPKIFSFKKGETEYQFGATPLGGFVKISGIIDESMDTEHLSKDPEPYEFRAKPVWQRLIVMTGGVIMNVILGIIIFSTMKYIYGDVRLPSSEVKYGIEVQKTAIVAGEEKGTLDTLQTMGDFLGFQTGDEVISFKGESFEFFEEYLRQDLLIDDDAYYEVRRNGELLRLEIPGNIQNYFDGKEINGRMFTPDIPAVVEVRDTFRNDDGEEQMISPAFAGGMRSGDEIIAVDSQAVNRYSQLRPYLKDKVNQDVQVMVLRDADTLNLVVHTDTTGKLGVLPATERVFNLDTIKYSFFGAYGPGTKEAFGFVAANAKGIGNMVKPGVEARKSVMGPFQIAKVFLQRFRQAGIPGFLHLTGILSMILAFVNILPIPALDGGHVVFLLIEGITRKEPSTKVRIIAQQIGMVFILVLMVLILGNDVWQLLT